MLIGQWLCYGMFDILEDVKVVSALALLAVSRVAEAGWDAMSDLDWFPHTFDEGMFSVIFASAPLSRVSASGDQIVGGSVLMSRHEYHGNFANRGTPKAYRRKAWKRFTDTGTGLTDLPMLEEQDALMAEEGKVVVVELAVAAVAAADNDASLDVSEDGG